MKRIFIGSSSEALPQAKQFEKVIRAASCEVDLWTAVFPPGDVTIEAIEREARRCSGAVFLASPDDPAVVRGKRVRVPRTNVMLEYGYFIALLGRKRVALCPYRGTELPTDLKGLTYVPMGSFPAPRVNLPLTTTIKEKILTWVAKLDDVTRGCSPVEVRHGYSGRWELKSVFTRWRGIDIRRKDYAHLDGYLYLHLDRDGPTGSGMLLGNFYVNVGGSSAHYKVCDGVSDVTVLSNGGISLTTEFFSREPIFVSGAALQRNAFGSKGRSPNKVKWTLQPHSRVQGVLSGAYISMEGKHQRSKSLVTIKRVT